VHGIASFGADNCDYPNVYARVSSVKDWICGLVDLCECVINARGNCS